jgi:hypothetical protein
MTGARLLPGGRPKPTVRTGTRVGPGDLVRGKIAKDELCPFRAIQRICLTRRPKSFTEALLSELIWKSDMHVFRKARELGLLLGLLLSCPPGASAGT